MSNSAELFESPIVAFSSSDQIIYALDTEEFGGAPSAPVVTAVNLRSGEVVTSTVLDGSPTIAGDVITLPTIKNLLANNEYGIDIQFVAAGNTFKRRLRIQVGPL